MTQEETLKRIEQEANSVADKWTAIELRHLYRDGFVAGAKSERNKVLDEIRNVYTDTLPSGDCQAWDFVKAAQEFLKRLESLKVDL